MAAPMTGEGASASGSCEDALALHVDCVSKSFGGSPVLQGIDVFLRGGQFVSLLGPSGCGKTTTLNVVSGFIHADDGRVLIDGTDVTLEPPYRRDTAVVFQNYALFPHLRVRDNVAYGLRARKLPKAQVKVQVEKALQLVGIDDLAHRYPSQLSGGQQQRVAVARSVAVRPRVLLMDEPLSNLDAKLRAEIRIELKELHRELGQSVLFVTHDQEEALSLSDQVIVMNAGRVEQVGSPEDVYTRPKTVFVADFMGIENILYGEARGREWCSGLGVILPLPDGGDAACLGVRPTEIGLIRRRQHVSDRDVTLEGTVLSKSYLGGSVRYTVKVAKETLVSVAPASEPQPAIGEDVTLAFRAESLLPLHAAAPVPQSHEISHAPSPEVGQG